MSSRFRRVRAVLASLQTAWSIAGVSLALVIVLEITLRLGFALKDWRDDASAATDRLIAQAQGDPVWPLRHARELEQLEDRWSPWVYFHQKAFHGQTITIDDNGHRATWRPPSQPKPARRPMILFMGGSTLWGYGSRDDHTIPSLAARRLFEGGHEVDVQNRAEIGYVSTQELISLVLDLERGDRPDVVVFLDGVNDTTSAALEGQAGLSTNESNRRVEFNLGRSAPRLVGALGGRVLGDSALYRLAQSARRRLLGDAEGWRLDQPRTADQGLVGAIVKHYAANVELIRSLGRRYGFRPLFFWQPVVFSKATRTPLEQAEAARYAALESIFRGVREQIEHTPELVSAPDFQDLSALFDTQSDGAFIDYCHITEKGNEQIAKTMLTAILKAIGPAGDRRRGESGREPESTVPLHPVGSRSLMWGMENMEHEDESPVDLHTDAACLGCGCLCDDLELIFSQGRSVVAGNACGLGQRLFQAAANPPGCRVDGKPAGLDEGIERAAEILAGARSPLVTGLEHASIESQRIAFGIARRIGAQLDTTSRPGRQAYWLAVQDVGAVGCTLGEIRHRSELVIAWRANPAVSQPRHFERYSLDAPGEFVPRGRGDRFLIAVDHEETATTALADWFIRLEPEHELDVLTALRALARGVAIDAEEFTARTRSSLKTWQDLVHKMKGSRHGALLFEPDADRLRNGAILRLVRELNEHTRFVASPLAGPGNPTGAEHVALWSTGYPGAIDLARGSPRYLPDESTTAALLERGGIDAILVVSGDLASQSTSRATTTLAGVPMVVLGDDENSTTRMATVALGVGRLGIEDSGTVFRSDGVPIPTRSRQASPLPTTRDLLARIDRAIAAVQESPGAA